MTQEPLHVLWIEPAFPGRMGAVADWLVRRRGYRCSFYCHTVDPRVNWPPSVGEGLDVQVFGVGGVARESAVAWSRALERSLCYSYGCWEVLEQRRPKSIDLVVGRSCGLGSSLFAPVYWPAAPIVSFLDYFYQAHQHDLAETAGPATSPAFFQWRRSMAAIDLLDLEQAALGWTPTQWQRQLYPAEYRDQFLVLHDGIDARRFDGHPKGDTAGGPRSIAGRSIPDGSRVVSFVARSVDRLRGFDRFLKIANALLRARSDVICVVVGDPIVRRGLDVKFHGNNYPAHLLAQSPCADADRFWMLGPSTPATVTDVLAASDVHIAPSRAYPVARSLLEAMAAGGVVLASDTAPNREVITSGQDGLLIDGDNLDAFVSQALAVLRDPVAYRPLAQRGARLVRERYSQDACLPRLAEQFSALAAQGRYR